MDDGLTPEQRRRRQEIADRFERELRAMAEDAPVLGATGAPSAAAAVRDEMRRFVRIAVADCGFDVEDQDRCAASVRVVDVEGGQITVAYEVDPRVEAYIQAIQQGDVERAIMLRAARDG